ncbi:OLC1v1027261C1 [Oldenlandia corymbosa var. corymbosa]|uniref:OLC1v1027261C1 n=1 Tax=Oldenlandia corymbosa var. corymbosa TaxID=529605 RepID=A0AAV1CA85_OLDCO|nr:OLC1v1027261C1 [Oldenlandia corymbosa var. corymbosa]
MDIQHGKDVKMEKREPSDATTRKRVKQSVSIPFVWEEFPGVPKKDWKPNPAQKKFAAPPAKYIASVPFKWEEKPGTPLQSFSQPPPNGSTFAPVSIFAPGQGNFNSFTPSTGHYGGHDNIWVTFNDQDGDEIDMQDSSYPETCDSETDDSYTSAAPSLLANGLVPTMAISNAVPVQQLSVTGFQNQQMESPASPDSQTDGSTASYDDTGATSLKGASFLEWLFPLLTPKANFLGKVDRHERSDSRLQSRKHSNDFLCEQNNSASITKPKTLGELIMMSRRYSYQRKAIQMQTQRAPKVNLTFNSS